MRAVLVLSLALLLGLVAEGCVTVAPYQREYLTSPTMDTALEEGEDGFQSHLFNSREGATGGEGTTGGGGCGCN